MTNQILTAFPHCKDNDCLQSYKNSIFWIEDPEGKSKCKVLLEKSDQCDFEVINPSEKEINFLAIDQCIFDDSDDKKCDFAVFDNATFTFVEIKNAKPRNRREHRKNALKQLESTISTFKTKLDFENYQLEANVCFSSTRKSFPQTSASNQISVKRFQDRLNTKLTEGNQKTFS